MIFSFFSLENDLLEAFSSALVQRTSLFLVQILGSSLFFAMVSFLLWDLIAEFSF